MASQLSKKAALPLAEVLATCSGGVSNAGPWKWVSPTQKKGSAKWRSLRPKGYYVAWLVLCWSKLGRFLPHVKPVALPCWVWLIIQKMCHVYPQNLKLFESHMYMFLPWYSQVPLWRGPIYSDITHGTAITVTESNSDFRVTTYTPYLALTMGVFCEDMGDNWPRYGDIAL